MRQHQNFKERNKKNSFEFLVVKKKFIQFCFTSVKMKKSWELHKWLAYK